MYGMSIPRRSITKVSKIIGLSGLCLLMALQPFPAYARNGHRISQVRIAITGVDYDQGIQPVVAAAAANTHCEVTSIWTEDEFDEDFFYDEEAEISKYPIYIMELEADDNYYFGGLNVTMDGGDVRCTGIYYADEDETVYLRCEFRKMEEVWLGVAGSAGWSRTGYLKWDAVDGAAAYELRVYRDDSAVGGLYVTKGTQYDVRPLLTKTGDYWYKVRPCQADGTAGMTVASDRLTVDSGEANTFRTWFEIPENVAEAEQKGIHPGWQSDARGWWYRKADGMFEQDNWQMIQGNWYYFDEFGYMVSNRSIDWKGTVYTIGADGIWRP